MDRGIPAVPALNVTAFPAIWERGGMMIPEIFYSALVLLALGFVASPRTRTCCSSRAQ